MRLLTIGHRPPRWAEAAFAEYASRLPPALRLDSRRLAPARGHGSDVARAREEEGACLLATAATQEYVVALDERGAAWSTIELARRLEAWQMTGDPVALWVGGADGLAPACRERADACWSLSSLVLPHALVGVIVAEQLYRAWTITVGHPYHRA